MKPLSGRFRGAIDDEALQFSSSLEFDRRLYREDIEGSIAHVTMLARRGILPAREAGKIRRALRAIRKEIETGRLSLTAETAGKERFAAEDIHMAIEHRLIEKIGPVGGKLHTARSRNDQVALDERLYLRRAVGDIKKAIRTLQRVLLAKAKTYRDIVMPGYTHLQRAQPVLLSHHLLAYVAMLERDHGRFSNCLDRAAKSPLGAGALAGTSYPIDRYAVAKQLGLAGIVGNSIDAVSDRDALLEFLSACSIAMMHLSRLSEELVLWTSQEWHFAVIGDAFTTGSSIMPQKKNPDMAELIRGKTGRVYGDLMALLTVMKGLPLAYNRDMQEDKEPVFDAADTVQHSLRIMAKMFATVRFDRTRFEAELGSDFLLATELADYLGRKGMPFRKAHAVVGGIVRECIEKGVSLREFPVEDYRRHARLFASDLYRLLDAGASLRLKQSDGSTSPKEVAKAIKQWEKKL